jgi:hypothetical protein
VTGNCTEHRHQLQSATGTAWPNEDWQPKCDADGTYAHTQLNKRSGLKFCLSKGGIILVAPQRSLADCECPRKRFEKFQSGCKYFLHLFNKSYGTFSVLSNKIKFCAAFEGYIHRCDTDFTYSVIQFDPISNSTSCLMKDAEAIPGYSGPHIVACKCPRQWHEAKTSPCKSCWDSDQARFDSNQFSEK